MLKKSITVWNRLILSFVLLLISILPANTHFLLNLNVRIFHVEHLSDGLKIYLRTPMPYLVADRLGPVDANGLPAPAPFTSNRMVEDKLLHYVDPNELRRDPKGLGLIAGKGLRLLIQGRSLEPNIEKVQVYPVGIQPKFATLKEAKLAFERNLIYPDATDPVYVGDAVVDVVLNYKTRKSAYNYTLSSNLNPGLPGQDNTANLILDYAPGETKVFRARGLLDQPITISRSTWAAVVTFIKEGVRHILEGLDHVLFVLCLVLGANGLNSLAWRITGFTIGHSVTLTAGFFGFVPSGAWFIPAVETGIALSIIYAAAISVLPRNETSSEERNLFFMTLAIGLLHGLGFSFVLHGILQINSPDIWQSLAAFNVGVEIGQLSIILVAWPLFRMVEYSSPSVWRVSRWGIAVSCAAVAAIWTVERALSVVGMV